MLKTIVAAGALALIFSAANAASADSELLSDWAMADMKSAIVATGSSVTEEGALDDGAPYFRASSPNGMGFFVYGTACSVAPVRCKGANLFASFRLETDADVDAREKAINRVAVGVRNAGDNELEVSRYLIFDDGLSRGNLNANLQVFVAVAEEIWSGGGE